MSAVGGAECTADRGATRVGGGRRPRRWYQLRGLRHAKPPCRADCEVRYPDDLRCSAGRPRDLRRGRQRCRMGCPASRPGGPRYSAGQAARRQRARRRRAPARQHAKERRSLTLLRWNLAGPVMPALQCARMMDLVGEATHNIHYRLLNLNFFQLNSSRVWLRLIVEPLPRWPLSSRRMAWGAAPLHCSGWPPPRRAGLRQKHRSIGAVSTAAPAASDFTYPSVLSQENRQVVSRAQCGSPRDSWVALIGIRGDGPRRG